MQPCTLYGLLYCVWLSEPAFQLPNSRVLKRKVHGFASFHLSLTKDCFLLCVQIFYSDTEKSPSHCVALDYLSDSPAVPHLPAWFRKTGPVYCMSEWRNKRVCEIMKIPQVIPALEQRFPFLVFTFVFTGWQFIFFAVIVTTVLSASQVK